MRSFVKMTRRFFVVRAPPRNPSFVADLFEEWTWTRKTMSEEMGTWGAKENWKFIGLVVVVVFVAVGPGRAGQDAYAALCDCVCV